MRIDRINKRWLVAGTAAAIMVLLAINVAWACGTCPPCSDCPPCKTVCGSPYSKLDHTETTDLGWWPSGETFYYCGQCFARWDHWEESVEYWKRLKDCYEICKCQTTGQSEIHNLEPLLIRSWTKEESYIIDTELRPC